MPCSLDSLLWDPVHVDGKEQGGKHTALPDTRCYREPVRCSTGGANCTPAVCIEETDVIQQFSFDVVLLEGLPQLVSVHYIKCFLLVYEYKIEIDRGCIL